MHGGAKGSGAPKGPGNGQYRHGQFTYESVEERRKLRAMLREFRDMLDDL
jgi:hypothetical protein